MTMEIKFNHFERAAKAYPKKVSMVVRKTGNDIIRFAAPNTPVDTGFLRMAVTVVAFSDLLVGVYWSAFYAIYQELGTRYIQGNFFATKAVEQARQPFIDAIKAINML
jgi:HK97 gp10 family phage protein